MKAMDVIESKGHCSEASHVLARQETIRFTWPSATFLIRSPRNPPGYQVLDVRRITFTGSFRLKQNAKWSQRDAQSQGRYGYEMFAWTCQLPTKISKSCPIPSWIDSGWILHQRHAKWRSGAAKKKKKGLNWDLNPGPLTFRIVPRQPKARILPLNYPAMDVCVWLWQEF